MCRRLVVRFGDTAALDGADLEVPEGSITGIIGPSGCGKSTLLRVVAGLQPPEKGQVSWRGEDLAGLAPHRRGFGLMFQDFALFPHRSVRGNVAFGLRMAGWSPPDTARRVTEVLELVGMSRYADRSVEGLSGGEQQRVALARTLAPRPALVMLDEPVASLDRNLRERLVVEMGEIFETLGVTVIYVTHDQEEAFTIADRVAVMQAGRMVRTGSPEEVWADPGSEFVARFLGHEAIVEVTVDGGIATVGDVKVALDLSPGRRRLAIPAGAVRLEPDIDGPGVVRHVAYRGGKHRIVVDVGGVELTGHSPGPPPPVGAVIGVSIDPERIIVLDS